MNDIIRALKRINPFKKTLAGLLCNFTSLADSLRCLAADKMAEAEDADAKADELTKVAVAAEREAEAALEAADRLSALVGNP